MHSYTIQVLTPLWWTCLLTSLLFIVVPLLAAKKLSPKNRELLGKIFGIIFLAIAILFHVYLLYIEKWNMQTSLPIHLCGMSGILAGLVFFWRVQLFFELLLYWGIPGGLHAILTPVLSHGYSHFLVFEYYLVHAGIILVPLFLVYFSEMKPRKNSWWNVFLISQLFLLSVGIINWLIGSNYMYTAVKPSVDNPLLMGGWPWYILGFEVVGIIHFYLVYLAFVLAKAVKS